MEQVSEGSILGTWGRTRDEMISFFSQQSALPISAPETNFKFDGLITKAMNSIVYSPDKTLKRLGHVDSPELHLIPDRFMDSISGIG